MTASPQWPLGRGRQLRPGQWTRGWIGDVDGGPAHLAYTDDTVLLEASNWTPDGRALLLNGDGHLWRLELGAPAEIRQLPRHSRVRTPDDHVGRLRGVRPQVGMIAGITCGPLHPLMNDPHVRWISSGLRHSYCSLTSFSGSGSAAFAGAFHICSGDSAQGTMTILPTFVPTVNRSVVLGARQNPR